MLEAICTRQTLLPFLFLPCYPSSSCAKCYSPCANTQLFHSEMKAGQYAWLSWKVCMRQPEAQHACGPGTESSLKELDRWQDSRSGVEELNLSLGASASAQTRRWLLKVLSPGQFLQTGKDLQLLSAKMEAFIPEETPSPKTSCQQHHAGDNRILWCGKSAPEDESPFRRAIP